MLNISESNLQILVSELRFTEEQMRSAQTTADRMYFFSAAPSMIQRLLNIEYDQQLLVAFQILSLAQNQINGRLSQPNSPPQQKSSAIMVQVIDLLGKAVGELAGRWENHQEINDVLDRVATIGYAATGNGHYLAIKGLLKL